MQKSEVVNSTSTTSSTHVSAHVITTGASFSESRESMVGVSSLQNVESKPSVLPPAISPTFRLSVLSGFGAGYVGTLPITINSSGLTVLTGGIELWFAIL